MFQGFLTLSTSALSSRTCKEVRILKLTASASFVARVDFFVALISGVLIKMKKTFSLFFEFLFIFF